MNKSIFFCLSVFLGCDPISEESTTVHNLIVNTTPHSIELSFYKDGNKLDAETQKWLPFEKKEVLFGRERGKGQGLTYPAIMNEASDSCLVYFDDTIQVAHYAYSTTSNNPKAISFSNSRSLYNQQNFVKSVIDEEKNSIELQYKFSFIEEDYIYARDK